MPGQAMPQRDAAAAPLASHGTPQAAEGGAHYNMMFVAALGLGYICCSAGLIAYNKFLMDMDRFPYAICLVLLHAIFCSAFSAILYLLKPSLFPSLTDPVKKVSIDTDLMVRGVLPIAVLFSAQLVLTNTAYLHSSVAFLQMMKEANLVLVYTFSLIAALEKFSWRSMGILAFIIFATTMTIHGEVNFSYTGFLIQGTGQIFECCKIVLQAMLLSNAGRKLDALTYVMLVMPCCAAFLGAGLCALNLFPHEHFLVPQWHHLEQWWPHLLANACIAFLLNVVIALFVKHSSAVAFILAGIVKDAMIVCTSVVVLREVITGIQAFGFGLQLVAILLWSMIKTFPDRFEGGITVGINSLIFGIEAGKGSPLAAARSLAKSPKMSNQGPYGSTEENSKC